MKSENEETKSMAGAKIAMGFIMLILIAVMLTCVFANRYLDMINRETPANNVAADSESIGGGENRMPTVKSVVKPIDDSKLVNILLVGQDSVPGDDIKRSDSMILCSVNPETKELVMVSFLRDLYVEIPGYAPNRLNTAYALGGFELLKQTLGYNFGVSIDGCFGVDFEGFSKIADTLGGVDIELSEAEAEIIGGLTAGMNHLNGQQVLEYTRIRKLDSDFGRTERQRNVLSAMIDGIKDSSAGDIIGLAEEILPCMTSDMSNAEIMSVLLQCYPALDSDISTCHVPGEGAYRDADINGMAVLVPDRQMIRQQLENELPL